MTVILYCKQSCDWLSLKESLNNEVTCTVYSDLLQHSGYSLSTCYYKPTCEQSVCLTILGVTCCFICFIFDFLLKELRRLLAKGSNPFLSNTDVGRLTRSLEKEKISKSHKANSCQMCWTISLILRKLPNIITVQISRLKI